MTRIAGMWVARVSLTGVVLAIAPAIAGAGQAAVPGQASPTAVAAAPDAAKEIATMQAKLNDWPQLGRYAAENAALGSAGKRQKRVVFFGDSITDAWGSRPNTGEFFPGKAY